MAPGLGAHVRLAQLRRDLESACNSLPETIAAARQCLEQMAASAAEVVDSIEALDADTDSEASGGRVPLPVKAGLSSMICCLSLRRQRTAAINSDAARTGRTGQPTRQGENCQH